MGARADSPERLLRVARRSAARVLRWMAEAVDALVPDRCLTCGDEIERGHARSVFEPAAWCSRCQGRVVALGRPFCLDCPADSSRWHCMRPAHLSVRVAVQYGEAVASLVVATKYERNPSLLVAWGEAWDAARRAAGEEERPVFERSLDLLVPVPAHPARLRERGWDVVAEWTRRLGVMEGLPVARALRRARFTPPQVGRDRARRRDNVAGAFRAGPEGSAVAGRRVAVVDDVVTTGATLRECVSVLRALGARSVVGRALAYEPLE